MKKLLMLFCVITMLFGMTACGKTENPQMLSSQPPSSNAEQPMPTTHLHPTQTQPQTTQTQPSTVPDHICSWIQVSCDRLECEICGVNDFTDAHVWWQIDQWTVECNACGETKAFPCDHEWQWISEDLAQCALCNDTRTQLHVHEWRWLDDVTAGCICGETKSKPCRHQWEQVDGTTIVCVLCGTTDTRTCSHIWKYVNSTTKECKLCGETKTVECEHQWQDATCDAPKTCYYCNATEGQPLVHEWLEADCINPVRCKHCLECKGNALGHAYVSGVCTRCGEEDTSYVPTFRAGEKWVVNGCFELSFAVPKPLFRADGIQTIELTWTYKDLGRMSAFGVVGVGQQNFTVYDSQMTVCDRTSRGVIEVNSVGQSAPGVNATCVAGYVLKENETQITVYVEAIGEKAYFVLDLLPYEPYATVSLGTSLPSNVTFTYEDHYCVCQITEVKLDIMPAVNGGGSLRATFFGTKTYDNRGTSSSFDVGWKLYDQDDRVVGTGYIVVPSLGEGESFADISASIGKLEKGGSYRLVLRSIHLTN